MDQGALIELVRQYRHLYDKSHPDFKNKRSRENAWKNIGEIMEYPREEVETIWTSLRNRYVTEKRKIRLVPTGSAPLPIWRYYKNMKFLDDFITIRKYVYQSNTEEQDSLTLGHDDEQSTQIETLGHDDEQSTQIDKEPKACGSKDLPRDSHKRKIHAMRKNRKQKADESNLHEKSVISALGAFGNIWNRPEDDEDILFGKSVGQSLAHIEDRKIKARAKIEILEVIEKYV